MFIAPSSTGISVNPSTSRSPSPAPPSYSSEPIASRSEIQQNANSNSWKCLSCGRYNTSDAYRCNVCPAQKQSTNNKKKQTWCWKNDDGLYIQYTKFVSVELDKLNVGETYCVNIGNATYQIRKISKVQCQQTNVKTKRQRLVILQNHFGSNQQYSYPSLEQNKHTESKSQSDINDPIQSQLLSMGFEHSYIKRAIKVYKHNFDADYDTEKITEIIFRLQKKDGEKMQENKNEDFLQLSDADSNNSDKPSAIKRKVVNENDFKMQDDTWKQLSISEWSRHQLKYWIYSLDMISIENRKKIMDGIEEFEINATDFQSCINGQEIADTFDIETSVGNVLYKYICNKNKKKTHRNVFKKLGKKIKRHKHKTSKTWKSKQVYRWSCEEIQDWIGSLDKLSEYNKLKLISGIGTSQMTGADFTDCRDGEDIADSFDGISIDVGNLLFDELKKVSNDYFKNEVSNLFYSSLSKSKYKIIEVKRIKTDKDKIYEQILQGKCRASGKSRRSIEKYLWHGSKNINNIKLICKNGFDRSYNTHSHYGPGTYYAKNAAYSVTGGFCGKDNSGVSYILLCKVIVGDYTIGNRSMKQIPRKSDGEEYDSLVNSKSNPTVFVVWRDYHAIPYYLIKYS